MNTVLGEMGLRFGGSHLTLQLSILPAPPADSLTPVGLLSKIGTLVFIGPEPLNDSDKTTMYTSEGGHDLKEWAT